MTDPRALAIMPLAAEGWRPFGARELGAIDRPTVMIVATGDRLFPEHARISKDLGASEKTMISFIGPDHMMVYDRKMAARIAHFATASIGYHLQGREDCRGLFPKDFVSMFAYLAWEGPPEE